jgi:hypothetical protein
MRVLITTTLVWGLCLCSYAQSDLGLFSSTEIQEKSYLDNNYPTSYSGSLFGLNYATNWISSQGAFTLGLSDFYLGYYDKINSYVLGATHNYRRLITSDYGSGVSMGLDYTRYDRLDYGQLYIGLELFTRQSLMQFAYYLPSSDAKQFSSASSQLVGMPGFELSLIRGFDRLSMFISYANYSEDKVTEDISALSLGGQFLFTNHTAIHMSYQTNDGLSKTDGYRVGIRLPMSAPDQHTVGMPSLPTRRHYGVIVGEQA